MPKSWTAQVRGILKHQAAAINLAATNQPPTQVELVIKLLLSCTGKVIVSGIGKSGIAARKIAATLTSTGTAAVFLHPSDALHGDLGIVQADDVVILVSNSGQNDEVLALLAPLKRRQVPLIAIVGNARSKLAEAADVVLDASVDREAGPLSLAPTTSTIVAISLGDALAMTLMHLKNVSEEDFALNHPAGRLGKRLTLRVADLMHGGKSNPVVREHTPWLDVVEAISQGGLGAVNVVGEDAWLLGIVTDGDLRRSIQNLRLDTLDSATAGQIMTRDPVSVQPNTLAYEALQLMEDRPSQISVLSVVDEQQRSVGLIRVHDLVGAGLR